MEDQDYRGRLSENAENFDSIVSAILRDYEALKEYVDSGLSDSELVIEKSALMLVYNKKIPMIITSITNAYHNVRDETYNDALSSMLEALDLLSQLQDLE